MKKEKRIINLGEEFQENKKMEQGYWDEFKRLDQCYQTCSTAKNRIYNYYKELLEKNADNVEKYGVRSYNSMVIVLHAIVEKDNKKYYLVITPAHNYFNELGE